MRMNIEQVPKPSNVDADPAQTWGRLPPDSTRAKVTLFGSTGALMTACWREGFCSNTGDPAQIGSDSRQRIFRDVFEQFWQYIQRMPDRNRPRRQEWITVKEKPQPKASTNSEPFSSQNQFCTTTVALTNLFEIINVNEATNWMRFFRAVRP